MKYTLDQIAGITGAEIISDNGARDKTAAVYTTLLTDSRSFVEPGSTTIFCAIRTDAADGHRFIPTMIRRGVKAFLVEEVPACLPEGCTFLKVKSVPGAIEAIGTRIRDDFRGTVVAITGSRAKTVVKEMLYQALLPSVKVFRSPRSWNSRLGVPLSLTEMPDDAQVAIIEVGIDSCGDMTHHAAMLRPDTGILTAITDEHAAGFESIDKKISEKCLLFKSCSKIAVDTSCPEVNKVLPVLEKPGREIYTTSLPGLEADAALVDAVCAWLGARPGKMCGNIASRTDVHECVNGCTVVYDNFTNDLRSVVSALDFSRRRRTPAQTMTVILGNVLHSPGEPACEVYSNVLSALGAYGVSRLITVGREISGAMARLRTPLTIETCADINDFTTRYDINNFSDELILVKGDTCHNFAEIRDLLEYPRHDTVFEINLDSIIHNFNYFRSHLDHSTGMIAMVKASAYGTGAPGIARTLEEQGASYLAVAVVDEGVELRRSGITMPIMTLNPVTTNYKALFTERLEPSVFSISELHTLVEQAERFGVTDYPVHIKLDTGMHRVGFLESELPELLRVLAAQSRLRVSTIFSHLATADCLDQDEYTQMQLDTFRRASDYIADNIGYPVKRHLLNTAGIMRYPAHQYDFVRLGIGLYGVSPIPGETHLKTVATLKSTIFSLKQWEPGTTIGYGRRGVIVRPSLIATIPIGYADGLNRHLSRGAASFIVRGVKCPTVGNICMDQCMIDVTDVPGVRIGDSVEIFGESNPVEKIAEILDTIPYEPLTWVSSRVKRIYFRE